MSTSRISGPSGSDDHADDPVEANEEVEQGSVCHRIHTRCQKQGRLFGLMKLPYAMEFDVPVDVYASYAVRVEKMLPPNSSIDSFIYVTISMNGPMGDETETFELPCRNDQILSCNYSGHEPGEKDTRLQYVLHHAVGLFQE